MKHNLFNMKFITLSYFTLSFVVGYTQVKTQNNLKQLKEKVESSQKQKSKLKDLTLEEAVMGQYRQFYPKGNAGLTWVKNTNQYAYLSNRYDTVFVKGGKKDQVISLTEINKALKQELKYIPGANWIGMSDLAIVYNNNVFTYNSLRKEGAKVLSFPKDAANTEFTNNYKKVAYTIDNNVYIASENDAREAVTKFEDKNIVSGQAIARSEFGITKGLFWSPSSEILAFYQKDESNVADYPLLDMTVTPGKLKSIKYPMAGQKSEQAKIGLYNTVTKKTTYLKVDGDAEQYLTNLGWGPESKFVYVAVVNRDQNHMILNKYDVASGALVKTLFEEKHDKWVEPENPVWFIPGSSDFLWLSERDGFMHAYRYSSNGDFKGQVTKGDWLVKSILGLDKSKKNLIVEGTTEDGLGNRVLSINLKSGKQNVINYSVGTHRFKLSDIGDRLIADYSNIETPRVQEIIATSGKKIKLLNTAENPYTKHKLAQTELMTLKAKDGTPLQARMIKPADFDPDKKYPVLVYVYGGPHAQMVTNSWLGGASLWMHYMANKGYIIFTLDNRGSANRGFEFENVIHRQLGNVEMEDQLVGVDFLKKQSFVDADRMAVHGWSFGGFMTTSLMLRKPGTFKVGVAGGPVTDWKFYEIMYGERYMDRPEQNEEGYKTASLLNYTDKLEGDLLLIHGTVDDVVVMQHNFALVQKFVEEGVLMDFFPYPNHPHNVRGKDRVHLMNKVLTYVEEKLAK